jgi:hypothetical protein
MDEGMNNYDTAQFRASAGNTQAFGLTPQDALRKLMRKLKDQAETPIVIWPYNHGDAFFSNEQNARLQQLKQRADALTPEELQELESLIEFAFDATIPRTQTLPPVKV